MKPVRILIVEDEAIVAMDIQARLEQRGYAIAGMAATGEDAIRLAAQARPDLVLMDIRLRGEMDGITAASQIRERFRLPVIFLTAHAEETTLQRAKVAEPFGYILKPFEERELHTLIEMALYKHRAEEEIRHLSRLYAALSQINQMIVRASDIPALLQDTCVLAVRFGHFKLVWLGEIIPGKALPRIHAVSGEAELERVFQAQADSVLAEWLPAAESWESQPARVHTGLTQGTDNGSWGEFARRHDLGASVTVALRRCGKVWGMLSCHTREPDFFGEKELNLVLEVGLDVGYALDNLDREAERQRMETALRQSEERYRSLVETSYDWIWEVDAQARYTYASSRVKAMLGYEPEEVLGRTPFDLMPPEEAERLAQLHCELTTDHLPLVALENVNLHKDGRRVVLETNGMPVFGADGVFRGYRGIDRDITERKRLEEQLRQSQKMEAVGQLAGGVAHDFNNLLAITLMQLGLLQTSKNLDAETRVALKELETQAERAADLTRQLLMFGRRSVMELKRLDLNQVVEHLLKMLRRLIGEHIDIEFTGRSDMPPVEADATMMEQVIMNLAVNARDAMPKGGLLTIATTLVEFDEAMAALNSNRRAGRFAGLRVTDTGCGMSPEIVDRIFEPFFTTKEIGKGTGLGLATVYGILKQHQGWVEVESEPSRGTAFQIWLPAQVAAQEQVVAAEPEEPQGGSETILLVEDDAGVRNVARSTLRALGYRVLEAGSGKEAMRVWAEHHHQVDLLFTDMVMPEGITGLDLALRLRTEKPGLKVMISSGYSFQLTGQAEDILRDVLYFPKPYAGPTLAAAVRRCFDHKEAPRNDA